MVEQTFGYLRPLDDDGRVTLVAPTHCRNGDRLGPDQVLVRYALCSCVSSGSHVAWTCRMCGDTQYSGGHTDDTLLDD